MANLHPGFILVLAGVLAAIATSSLRRVILVLGPLAALVATAQLEIGTDLSFDFINGYQIGYLYLDKLSFIFLLILSIMAAVGGLYSAHNTNRMEAFCSMSYAGCAMGLVLAKDWLTLIFFWEALAVTSLFLVWCNKTPAARRAGFRYLLVHMLGGNLLLFGIFLKVTGGDFLVTNLATQPHDCAYWLILCGAAVNAAIPPLNAWIADAYPESTITGGVFMSAFTTKVTVYCLLRIFAGAEILIWLGCFMALYGACYAIMENDMRRLLSYHIISQIGFMVAGAGLGTAMSMNGAAAHVFTNILDKSLLFMTTGAIIYATGIRTINQLGGMAKRLPLVAACFFVASFSIAGVPLFNAFISKTMTIAAAAEAGYGSVYTLLELASIGTFLSISLKMGYFIFLRTGVSVSIKAKLPTNMSLAMAIGAVLCTIFGLCPNLLYRFLPYGAPTYVPYTAAHVLAQIEILAMTMLPFMMYLSKMEPHTALSLDTDWFYRKPISCIITRTAEVCCALCAGLGDAWGVVYEKFLELTANPMDFLDARPFRKRSHYNPENYRTSIADPMMVTLTMLVVSIFYFISRVQ